jgi:acetyl-CoA synthetase
MAAQDAAGRAWTDARATLDGLPTGGLNIAHEALDRHVRHGHGDDVAIRWLGKTGERRDVSYRDLAGSSNRFAHALDNLGIAPGDTVFLLLGRVPALYTAALGSLKAGAVVCPLFSAFGPDPIAQRMQLGSARAIVTTTALYERKVAGLRERVPTLRAVILVDAPAGAELPDGVHALDALDALDPEAAAARPVAQTTADTPALLHFTSGTTGTPKGVVHVHEAIVAHVATGASVLGLHRGAVFWCTADPGWVTGTSYGIVAPLAHGATMIVDEAEFDVERWYATLEREQVEIWYTAPTALRMLMRAGTPAAKVHDLRSVRRIASVGEPLNPEVVLWGREAYGQDILDNWWQTETGGIMIANRPDLPVKPGSMGTPVPGIEAAVLRRDDQGEIVCVDGEPVVEPPGVEGELALRAGWPSMFRAYLGMEERYRRCFVGSWYRSGDLARVDDDGWFWFVGRADDVIKSAGHLIGPFEVESALIEHPAVAEAAVIGLPDPVVGEVVKAYVVLRPGVVVDDALRRDLVAHARRRLGPAVAPREIAIRDELPRTRSGKILRRLLKARELGLPEGDLSTLERG